MFLTLDAVEAELINDQKIIAGQLPDLLRQGLVGQGSSQLGQQHGAGEVANAETVHTGTTAQRFEQKRLADARLPDHHEVTFAADEVGGGQLLDLWSLHAAFEVPVELLQETDLAEAGIVDTAFDGAFASLVGQAAEQAMSELQVRPAFLLGLAQQGVKRLARRSDLQGVQMVQQQAAQVRRRRRLAAFRHGVSPR